MICLIDENLPDAIGLIFSEKGFTVESVRKLPQLLGQTDEVVFNYAVKRKAVIVTRDLDFSNPLRFDLGLIPGVIVLRFPSQVSTSALAREIARLTKDISEKDFENLIIIEPGFMRVRKLR